MDNAWDMIVGGISSCYRAIYEFILGWFRVAQWACVALGMVAVLFASLFATTAEGIAWVVTVFVLLCFVGYLLYRRDLA